MESPLPPVQSWFDFAVWWCNGDLIYILLATGLAPLLMLPTICWLWLCDSLRDHRIVFSVSNCCFNKIYDKRHTYTFPRFGTLFFPQSPLYRWRQRTFCRKPSFPTAGLQPLTNTLVSLLCLCKISSLSNFKVFWKTMPSFIVWAPKVAFDFLPRGWRTQNFSYTNCYNIFPNAFQAGFESRLKINFRLELTFLNNYTFCFYHASCNTAANLRA